MWALSTSSAPSAEAPDLQTALGGREPSRTIELTPAMIREARDELSTTDDHRISAIALGSPHFSLHEFEELDRLIGDTPLAIPFYVCTGRGVREDLERTGRLIRLRWCWVASTPS